MTRSERAMQLWPFLIALAHNRQTATYGQLGGALDIDGGGVFAQTLDLIANYCSHRHFPQLTCLIVNKTTGLPGDGWIGDDLHAERERVYQQNWYALYPPQIIDFV